MTGRLRQGITIDDRLTGCLISRLARVSARKRAYTHPETNAETSTQRSYGGRWRAYITVAVFQSVTALQLRLWLVTAVLLVTRCHLLSVVVAQVARAAMRVL